MRQGLLIGLTGLMMCGSPAFAASDVALTPQEIRLHGQRAGVIAQTASQCLDRTYQTHLTFYKKWGVSKYYGGRRPDYATREGRIQALLNAGRPAALESQLESISCIGLTMRCLEEGFAAAGLKSTWVKIYNRLAVNNAFYGTDLQKMLRKLGWKSYYWNPDPSQNESWDAEDRRLNPLPEGRVWNPVWGGHAARYRSVMTKSDYYGIPIDNATDLVGFGDRSPAFLANVPFFVGTAHSGYHVFPGRRGTVIEAHSMRNLTSKDNLETSPFAPLAPGGGPRWTRSERYRSGVILVPPL